MDGRGETGNRGERGAPRCAPRGTPHRVVVFSDVHLHAARRPPCATPGRMSGTADTPPRSLAEAVRALHDGGRAGDVLVLAGDTFDLFRESPAGPFASDVEHLDAIWACHIDLLLALRAWVAAERRLVFVAGNHDLSLPRPEVAAALRRRLAPGGDGAERVEVRAWFYHEPGVLYVEHGHQYDPDARVEDPFAPPEAGRCEELGRLAHRHVVSPLRGAVGEADEHSTALELTWRFLHRPRRLLRALRAHARFVGASLRAAARRTRRAARGTLARLDPVETFGLSTAQLERLRAAWQDSTLCSLAATARRLYVSHALLLALLLFAGVLYLGLDWGPRLLGPTGIPLVLLAGSAAAACVHARACRFREHRLQQQAARIVARVTGAHFVVMGHSHIPCRLRLPDRRTYFNVGRTLPRASREDWTQGLVVWTDGERHLALRVREFLDLERFERRSRPTLQPGRLPTPQAA